MYIGTEEPAPILGAIAYNQSTVLPDEVNYGLSELLVEGLSLVLHFNDTVYVTAHHFFNVALNLKKQPQSAKIKYRVSPLIE